MKTCKNQSCLFFKKQWESIKIYQDINDKIYKFIQDKRYKPRNKSNLLLSQ